jgi:hypothetical protein
LPRPEFVLRSVEGEENLHVCILRLPPNAPFQEVLGSPSTTQIHAKQLACLEACKRLHGVGAVDDYLIPITEAVPEEEETVNSKGKNTTGAGRRIILFCIFSQAANTHCNDFIIVEDHSILLSSFVDIINFCLICYQYFCHIVFMSSIMLVIGNVPTNTIFELLQRFVILVWALLSSYSQSISHVKLRDCLQGY